MKKYYPQLAVRKNGLIVILLAYFHNDFQIIGFIALKIFQTCALSTVWIAHGTLESTYILILDQFLLVITANVKDGSITRVYFKTDETAEAFGTITTGLMCIPSNLLTL